MVFVILIGATVFTLIFRGFGGDELVGRLLEAAPGGKSNKLSNPALWFCAILPTRRSPARSDHNSAISRRAAFYRYTDNCDFTRHTYARDSDKAPSSYTQLNHLSFEPFYR